jgi:hypothetical protein
MSVTIGSSTITGIASGGLPSNIINSTNFATNAVTTSDLNFGGAVLQAVCNSYTGTQVINVNATFTSTNITATITPTLSTSRVLVIIQIMYAGPQEGDTPGWVLYRNSTAICQGAAGSGQAQVTIGTGYSTDNNSVHSPGVVYLDSPATTSACTYTLYSQCDNTSGVYINRSVDDYTNSTGKRGTSTVTLLEIK